MEEIDFSILLEENKKHSKSKSQILVDIINKLDSIASYDKIKLIEKIKELWHEKI